MRASPDYEICQVAEQHEAVIARIAAAQRAELEEEFKAAGTKKPVYSITGWVILTLIQHGTDDQLADIAGSHELEDGAVNATVTSHYYDGLYHEIFNEPERDRVYERLREWLDRWF